MAIVQRAWLGLFVILMTLLRPLVSWLSEAGENPDSEPAMAPAHDANHDEAGDDAAEHGRRLQGVTQAPPPAPFQPMLQGGWNYWYGDEAEDPTWYARENLRMQQNKVAVILTARG